jgi:hypothetical protein
MAEQAGLRSALQEAAAVVGELSQLDDAALASWDGIARALQAASDTFSAVRSVEHAISDPTLLAQAEGLGTQIASRLVALHLRSNHPRLHRAAALLTLVAPAETVPASPLVVANGQIVRLPWRDDSFRFDRAGALLREPFATLRDAYFPNDLARVADAYAAAELLLPPIGLVATELGLRWHRDVRSLDPPGPTSDEPSLGDHFSDAVAEDGDPGEGDPLAVRLRRLPQLVVLVPLNDVRERLAVEATVSSAEHPGGVAGVIVSLESALAWSETFGNWKVEFSGDGQLPAFVVGPGGLDLAPSSSPLSGASARLSITRLPGEAGEPAFVFGSATGTRIELGGVRAESQLAVAASGCSASLSVRASSGRLVIASADGDGFLQYVLPSDGVKVAFDAGFVLSSARGFELLGGVGFEAVLPAHVSLGSIGSIDDVRLGVGAADGGLQASVACGLTVHVGPVDVSIGGLGVSAVTTFPPQNGNLGVADLAVGFKAPTQLGLSIDAGPVTGGGMLAADPDRGQYAGEVHLQFEQIAVRATGLLTTHLPDGKPGFSLLVIVSAEFPPVQLGLGFMLVDVGGLLGINRTVAVDALRAGLKTGALSAVLSPPDPKASASQLVASLAGLFPPAAGRHLFAPTARIVWGSPTLITIDLALVLELPAPVRLVALGRLRAVLPDEREAIVRLQVDALGVIDFDRAEAAVDATLVDSRLAGFALTGDMALRMSWGDRPSFLLAVGGFHPRFAAPSGFPELQRVAVALAGGDNPKLRLEAYLALTSNTVQFGARVDLGARAGSFSIAGFLSFDALLTLEPLAFQVDIAAKLAVKVGGHTLLSVSLALTLSGPRPWHAHGRASFSILFFDVSFGFDVTIGDATPTALPAPVDVAPLLIAALADARAWTAQLPTGANAVTFRKLDPGTAVLAHPLGTLQVRQRVAPLERTLDRFGTSVPSGARRFRITLVTIGGVRTTVAPLQDRFAPAQFTALSDDAKLSAPSFEEMVSGAALGADGYATGPAVSVPVVYEQALVTAAGVPEPQSQKLAMPADVFSKLTATPPRRTGAFAVKDGA